VAKHPIRPARPITPPEGTIADTTCPFSGSSEVGPRPSDTYHSILIHNIPAFVDRRRTLRCRRCEIDFEPTR